MWILVVTFLWLSGGQLSLPVHDPAYASERLCETARTELTFQLYPLWPDPLANVKKITANCKQRG